MKRYFAINILFCLLITANSLPGLDLSDAQVVEIPDPNLREAIREQLQLPDGTLITQQEMLKLIDLAAPRSQIADLTGLEYATNLTGLSLWGNSISDLTPLSNLTQLRGIDLAGCDVADITPLANLTQLEVLNLGWNDFIQDITPLANLTKLYHLKLTGNRIVDISPLANLTQLKELFIDANRIFDFSPIEGLSLTLFEYDKPCELPALPIQERIKNRTFPSVFAAWGGLGWSQVLNLPELSDTEHLALHDLYWTGGAPLGLEFVFAKQGWAKYGDLEKAQSLRDSLLALNPNMLFLAEVRMRDATLSRHPEDFPYWLRDANGNRINVAPEEPESDYYLIDFTQPGMQDIIVQQALAVAKCGLFDGIFLDWWKENHAVIANDDSGWNEGYRGFETEQNIRDNIIQRIRSQVREDFLILGNTNRTKIPRTAWAINGTFMETGRDNESGYTHEGLKEIEDTLLWAEANLREPQINCPEGWGIPTEPPDSPANLRFMRVFTSMSLTCSDGYVLYNMDSTHQHVWYSFWDADLGHSLGAKAQHYQNIDGLFIREFTNGWAVYNRSGKTQAISLPRPSIGVSSNKEDITHLLPDLDGEIYLRKGKPYDLNRDGIINILDLILVSQHFGTAAGDVNGDGTTNILDLTAVAQQFN